MTITINALRRDAALAGCIVSTASNGNPCLRFAFTGNIAVAGPKSTLAAWCEGFAAGISHVNVDEPPFTISIDNCAEGFERLRRNDETVFVTQAKTWGEALLELLDGMRDADDDFNGTDAWMIAADAVFETGREWNARIAKSKADTSRIVWYFKKA